MLLRSIRPSHHLPLPAASQTPKRLFRTPAHPRSDFHYLTAGVPSPPLPPAPSLQHCQSKGVKDPQALDLLEQLLRLDPKARIVVSSSDHNRMWLLNVSARPHCPPPARPPPARPLAVGARLAMLLAIVLATRARSSALHPTCQLPRRLPASTAARMASRFVCLCSIPTSTRLRCRAPWRTCPGLSRATKCR